MDVGYYVISLADEMDRLCLQRLLQLSKALQVKRQNESIFPWPVGDLSQKGNWSSFRNEYINGKPGVIDTESFTPLPSKVRTVIEDVLFDF